MTWKRSTVLLSEVGFVSALNIMSMRSRQAMALRRMVYTVVGLFESELAKVQPPSDLPSH